MKKALVFDMDGLLLDSERIVQRSWNEAGNLMGIFGVGEHIYNTLGMNRKARNAYFRQALGPDFDQDEFNKKASECFFRIVKDEGLPVKKGAIELLKHVKAKGYKTAVATSSSREYATGVLKNAGLYQYFDSGVFGDMVEHAKPDPEIYLKACENIGVNPKDCLALEDAPAGVRSAHAAGLTVIVVPDLVQPTEDILSLVLKKCNSLDEVIHML